MTSPAPTLQGFRFSSLTPKRNFVTNWNLTCTGRHISFTFFAVYFLPAQVCIINFCLHHRDFPWTILSSYFLLCLFVACAHHHHQHQPTPTEPNLKSKISARCRVAERRKKNIFFLTLRFQKTEKLYSKAIRVIILIFRFTHL